jgi:hypothetical protein
VADEVVRRLTVSATSTGIDDVTGKMKTLAGATVALAEVTDASAKRALSAEAAYNRQTLALDPAARAQASIEKATKTANAALAQGIITQDEHSKRVQTITDKYTTQVGAGAALGKITQSLQFQMAAMAGGLGLTGQVLSAFGPWGFAAAVGLGVVTSGLNFVSDASHALAQKSKEIFEFSEAVGLTTSQFQALKAEAGKFGIDSEALAKGLSKFTAGFDSLRLGSGQLLTDINKINPALADQMKQTTDSATAFTLFGKAVAQTDDIFQRNALLKAGLGKGSAQYGAFFASSPDVNALSIAFAAAGKGIDENLINKLRQLQIEIDKTNSVAKTIFASTFGTSTLEAELTYAKTLLEISKTFKLITEMNFPNWLNDSATYAGKLVLQLTPLGTIVSGLILLKGLVSAGAAAYDSKPVSMANYQSPSNSYSSFQKSNVVPEPTGSKTLEALSAESKNLTAVLGSAATPAQKLDAAIKALGVTAKDTGVSASDLAKGVAALKFDDAVAQQNAYNAAMGVATPLTDLLIAKKQALAIANRNGAGLTKEEIANQIRLTAEQYNGVGAIKAQSDSISVQAAAVHMGAGAGAEYTAVQTKLNEAIRNGNPLEAEQETLLRRTAAALGAKSQAAASDGAASQALFDRQTMFMSGTEQQIAAIQKQLHGDAWQSFMNDGLSSTLRLNAGLKELQTDVVSFGTDLSHGLTQGLSLMNSLSAAAKNLGSKLLDTGLNSLLTTGMNSLMGSGTGAAALSAGGTSAAAAITAACTAGGAALAAGGTTAAAALGSGGTVAGAAVTTGGTAAGVVLDASGTATGVVVGAGGATAGAALTAGGTAAGLALWGPIAALAAIVAGGALSIFGGGSSSKGQQQYQADLATQQKVAQTNSDASLRRWQDQQAAALAGTDQNTLQGQLAAFDSSSQQQRLDEAHKGNGAIVELEQMLAAQRLAIVKKSNDAIAKTMNDFLNSVKTGSQSILSPADQLAYEQNLFNKQLSGAQHGNASDLNALTTTASALLTLAQNFYASGTGYADVYKNVTEAITSIASSPGQSVTADSGITHTADTVANIGYMTDGAYSNPQNVGYAAGGLVLNGKYGVDSVNARLAGGEHVTKASSVNAATRSSLDYINRTGKTPGNDNSELARILTQGFNGQTQVLSEKLDMIAERVKRVEDTTRQTNNQRRVPGTQKAA